MRINKIIFVSGYTINTPYEKEIKHLEKSLKEFELPYTWNIGTGNKMLIYAKNNLK